MIAAKELPGAYVSSFARLEKALSRDGQGWLASLRKEAISRFAELGFPTTKLEEWKYTDVSPIAKTSFQAAEFRADGLPAERLSDLPLAHAAFSECCSRIVFVNGHYNPQLSSPDLPERVLAGSLSAAIKRNASNLQKHLARYASIERHAFVALNTAFMEDGAFIEIPTGVAVETPIHLLFVSTADEPIAAHPRNLIIVGDNSQASIIEDYVALGDAGYFTNAVTEIIAGENSVVDHYKLQAESERAFHIATVQVHQARASSFTAHSVSLGGGIVRNDVNVVLDGEGAECALNGLYVTAHDQHVDNHTVIDHAKPHCISREIYKGILDDQSSAVFNGSIVVRKDAQKTDARQSNKNLLLSEYATINSKPQLEINADDVKCSHGTSIGHLEEDSIYYLRSRGIGVDEARAVLTYGFANDVLNRMKLDAVRVRLECALLARMPGRHPQLEES
ncbi:MAG TPA: Fe-S cluster assembly protein SufD [Blastocatellia bacterium]|nr:Fe-S cluster assembly protein SufD [Blastocatellia bacterium]